MLPDKSDIRAHQKALSKRRLNASVLATSILTPETLGDEILKVARATYRQGHRVAKCEIELPYDNFRHWALARQLIVGEPSNLDNEVIRRSVLNATDEYVRTSLGPGVFFSFTAIQASSDSIKFGVEISFINPSDG